MSTEEGRGGEAIIAICQAQQDLDDAKRHLHETVLDARDRGHTWHEIGATLDMSRQAAFKRFGRPADPASGESIPTRHARSVVERTERAIGLIAAGDHDGIHAMMEPDTASALTATVIADTWRQVLAEVGDFERCAGTHAELPDGTSVDDDQEVIGVVIGATEIECEAGSVVGRIAFDADDRIIGMLIVPDGATDLPF